MPTVQNSSWKHATRFGFTRSMLAFALPSHATLQVLGDSKLVRVPSDAVFCTAQLWATTSVLLLIT